jgi:hypothetical protein
MESIIAKRKFIINSKFKIQNSKFSAYFSNTLSYPTGGLPSPPSGCRAMTRLIFFCSRQSQCKTPVTGAKLQKKW